MRTRRPGESALLLLDAVRVLDGLSIPYAVIGAMAASVHGVVRASMDADAAIFFPSHRVEEIEQEFRAVGFETELRRGDAGDPIAAVLALADASGNSVDLLVGLRGLRREAFSRVLKVPFHGQELRVIGLEDFIAMKLFAGGPQDLSDAAHARAAAGEGLDVPLLKRLTADYGHEAKAALEKLRSAPP